MKEIKLFLKHWGYEASGIIVVISMFFFFASKEAYLVGFAILIIAVIVLVLKEIIS